MAKIYYIGDWAVLTGPVFAESPFNYAPKGLEMFNYGTWLKEALESDGRNEVVSVATWDFYNMPPGGYEKILDAYDVIIFSDVEAKLFQLNPHFFSREKFGTKVLTFPDRIRLTTEAIKSGKKVIFMGGWLSYTGVQGKGGWGRTRLKDILPVQCMDYEDLVESTEGFHALPEPGAEQHFPGIDFASFPPILGYNKVKSNDAGRVILSVKETGDPLLAVAPVGDGAVLTYMSDPAPHWGCNFVYWKQYKEFWLCCLDLLGKE
jgi:uncharacterized membrane protein